MLKFTYSETGLHLEHLTQTLEDWMSLRVVLSMRTGQRVVAEQCTASFLLSADLVELPVLKLMAEDEVSGFSLSLSDDEWVEVGLRGTWFSSQLQSAEGVFVTALSKRAESLLFTLWQASQTRTSSLKT